MLGFTFCVTVHTVKTLLILCKFVFKIMDARLTLHWKVSVSCEVCSGRREGVFDCICNNGYIYCGLFVNVSYENIRLSCYRMYQISILHHSFNLLHFSFQVFLPFRFLITECHGTWVRSSSYIPGQERCTLHLGRTFISMHTSTGVKGRYSLFLWHGTEIVRVCI